MGSLFGGKKTTTTTRIPAPTAEEKQLIAAQLKLASEQLNNLDQVGDFTSDVFTKVLPDLVGQINRFLPQQQQITGKTLGYADEQIAGQSELFQSELEAIRSGVKLTPEQEKFITDAASSSIESGLSDIRAFRDESLRSLAQETSIARGLRPEDTPILDVGGRIVNESSRQAADLVSTIRAQEAQQKLQYPLAAGQFQAERTQAQQTLGSSTMQFIEQMRQNAINSRLAVTGTVGDLGLKLSSIGPNASTLQGMQAMRSQAATTTQKTRGGGFMDFLTSAASLASGVGSLMSGVGAIGGIGSLGFAAG